MGRGARLAAITDIVTRLEALLGPAGGDAMPLEGGITNGAPVVCRAAMKPIATLKKALEKIEKVDPAVRNKYRKIYRYY